MKGNVTAVHAARPDLRSLLVAGMGLAVLWLLAFLTLHPAPAAASEEATTTVLRSGTFGDFSSDAERPVYRHHYRSYHHEQETYGFMTLGGGLFDPAKQPGNGFYGVATVGTEVGHSMDLGVSGSWYHRASHGESFTTTVQDPAGNNIEQSVQTQEVNTDLVPLMAIVRIKFPTPAQFQPYIGGGAGYEWLFVDGTDNLGFHFHQDYGGFGAQALGGVSIMASENTGVYGEAVYNFSTVSNDFFDPSLNTTVHESLNMDGLAIHGGLRFRF